MDEYPNPDEEYELMYADELELLKEQDENDDSNVVRKKPLPAKRSLDFSSPVPKKTVDRPPISQTNGLSNVNEDIPLTPSLEPMGELLTPVSNKRTTEDLFGDIGDIDFDDIQLPSKRQKTEEENDEELINKIIESRKMRQLLAEPTGRVQNDLDSIYNQKENLSLNIPRWAFMPLTNNNGDRVYIRLDTEDNWEKSLDDQIVHSSLHSSYAGTWDEARKILEEKQHKKEQDLDPASQPLPSADTNVCGTLWVEKYRPQSYLDLLSEEPVNRALLHWLHLWDKIVFKKEVKSMEPQQRTTFSKRAGQFQLTNKWRGKKEAEPEMDADGRPHHKVALLAGPPGVGKTTLAHLLAKLAGYRPVELNASDERSTEAFRTALQSATLMRSVLDKDKRPNCLILDEIDGAPLPTVELLVKWCTATNVEAGKKKSKSQPLRRPIIAICNDLYASSLRPLRAISLIIRMWSVPVCRLTSRLSSLCARERVAVTSRALAALAARAQGDVRAAVTVLAFLRKKQINMEDIENLAIGTKDCTKSMMQALQAIFTVNDKDPAAILKTIQAAGEYDRIMDGIFENYLQSRVDSRLQIACEALNWLLLYDIVNSRILRTQNYSLYGILPLCAARCHRILATRSAMNIRFPTQALEMSKKKAELDSIVCSVWRGSVPAVSVSRRCLLLDVLPLLPYLLAPNLRSNNVQLCSSSERAALVSCAGAMCDYGVQYVQQRAADGLYACLLEPDVHKVAFFGNEERVRPPPAIRQAISREQQLEVIRRNEEMAGRVKAKATSSSQKPAPKKDVKEPPNNDIQESRLPNHLQRLQPKAVTKSTPQVHKDFFGRIVPLSQVQRSETLPDVISSSSVFYQYREGFNNAVRRNVKTKDML